MALAYIVVQGRHRPPSHRATWPGATTAKGYTMQAATTKPATPAVVKPQQATPAPVQGTTAPVQAPKATTALTPAQVQANAAAPQKVTKGTAKALAAVAGFTSLQQVVATVAANPRRPNSAAHGNWQYWVPGQTVAACIAASVAAQANKAKAKGHTCAVLDFGWACWDFAHGTVTAKALAVAPKA